MGPAFAAAGGRATFEIVATGGTRTIEFTLRTAHSITARDMMPTYVAGDYSSN